MPTPQPAQPQRGRGRAEFAGVIDGRARRPGPEASAHSPAAPPGPPGRSEQQCGQRQRASRSASTGSRPEGGTLLGRDQDILEHHPAYARRPHRPPEAGRPGTSTRKGAGNRPMVERHEVHSPTPGRRHPAQQAPSTSWAPAWLAVSPPRPPCAQWVAMDGGVQLSTGLAGVDQRGHRRHGHRPGELAVVAIDVALGAAGQGGPTPAPQRAGPADRRHRVPDRSPCRRPRWS